MSFATIIGLLAAMGFVVMAMAMGGSFSTFVNGPGLLIVIGGTVAATFIRYSLSDVVKSFTVLIEMLKGTNQVTASQELIDVAEDAIRRFRAQGTRGLEAFEVNSPFYQRGLRYLSDGMPLDATIETLKSRRELFIQRSRQASKVWGSVGDSAPAFGMIGTIVGLVQMLSNLDDPSSIGPAMAVAMLTTLYGAMIANLIALPLSEKIESWAEVEAARKELIIQLIGSIGVQENPQVMRDKTLHYISLHAELQQN